MLDRRRRHGIEYPIWSAVHGLAVLTGQGPLREVSARTRQQLEELTFIFIDRGLVGVVRRIPAGCCTERAAGYTVRLRRAAICMPAYKASYPNGEAIVSGHSPFPRPWFLTGSFLQ